MSRRACLRRSRKALVGMRLPFSSSPRNKMLFMGFANPSGPFSDAHVAGHCKKITLLGTVQITGEGRQSIV